MHTIKAEQKGIRAFFHRLSIQTKLVIIILSASVMVIAVGFAAIIYWDVKSINKEAVQRTELAVSVLSQDLVKILMLDSVDVAADTVSKLRAFPEIKNAVLYDREGEAVFSYRQDMKKSFIPPPPKEGKVIEHYGDYYDVFIPGEYLKTRYGILFFRVSATVQKERLHGYYKVVVLVTPFLLALSVFIAIKFQRFFSIPILRLVQVIKRVSATHDYSHKLTFEEQNEIGELYQGFNLLMEQIDFNTRKLRAVKEEVEHSNKQLRDANTSLQEQKFALDQAAKVSITDDKGVITYVNDQFCSMSKYSKQELIGKSYRLIKSGFHTQEFFRDLWQTVASGRVWKGEIQNRAKDGSYYWVNTTIVPFMSDEGDAKQYLAIHFDITDRKEAERSLRSAKELAEAAVTAQTEFVKTLSREVRQPMKQLLDILSSLLYESGFEKYYEQIDEARESADYLLTLFNDVLDYSRILAGKLEFHDIDFNIRSTVDEVLGGYRDQARLKSVELVSIYSAALPQMMVGDPTRLREIINTFLAMVLSFARQGGVFVNVSIEPIKGQQAFVRFDIKATSLILSVDLRSRLMNAFTQLDASMAQLLSGNGMGPSLSKRLIKMMGGEMGIESLKDEGSLFWFKVALRTEADTDHLIGGSGDETSQYRILYCGGDDAIYQKLREKVCDALSDVNAVSDLQKAYSFLQSAVTEKQPIDLVLFDLDLSLDKLYEAGRTIRANPMMQGIKLVLLSCGAQRGDSEMARQAGFAGYLSKPLTIEELCTGLRLVLGQSEDDENRIVTRYACQELRDGSRRRALFMGGDSEKQLAALRMLRRFEISMDVAASLDEIQRMRAKDRYCIVFVSLDEPHREHAMQMAEVLSQKAVTGKALPVVGFASGEVDDLEVSQVTLFDEITQWPGADGTLEKLLKKWLPQ